MSIPPNTSAPPTSDELDLVRGSNIVDQLSTQQLQLQQLQLQQLQLQQREADLLTRVEAVTVDAEAQTDATRKHKEQPHNELRGYRQMQEAVELGSVTSIPPTTSAAPAELRRLRGLTVHFTCAFLFVAGASIALMAPQAYGAAASGAARPLPLPLDPPPQSPTQAHTSSTSDARRGVQSRSLYTSLGLAPPDAFDDESRSGGSSGLRVRLGRVNKVLWLVAAPDTSLTRPFMQNTPTWQVAEPLLVQDRPWEPRWRVVTQRACWGLVCSDISF